MSRPATLGAAVRRGAVTGTVLTIAAWVAVVSVPVTGRMDLAPPAHPATPLLNPAGPVMARHGCWSGQAPAKWRDRLPGGVVYAVGQGRPRYSADPVIVGHALDEVLGKRAATMRVFGFCPEVTR